MDIKPLNPTTEAKVLEIAQYHSINPRSLDILSYKDGVLVVVLQDGTKNHVLKYFERLEYARELEIYKLFHELGIQTMPVIDFVENGILLENMANHPCERLATKADLEDPSVVKGLAKWYLNLHTKGRNHLISQGDQGFYSELRLLTTENLDKIRAKSGYEDPEFWTLLPDAIRQIMAYFEGHKTITYNDFFYGNAVVSRDLAYAYIFDYNFVGAGLAYLDISNVVSGLPEAMHPIFCEAYGEISPFEKEINHLVSPLIGLCIAYERDQFPDWGLEALDQLRAGEVLTHLRNLIN